MRVSWSGVRRVASDRSRWKSLVANWEDLSLSYTSVNHVPLVNVALVWRRLQCNLWACLIDLWSAINNFAAATCRLVCSKPNHWTTSPQVARAVVRHLLAIFRRPPLLQRVYMYMYIFSPSLSPCAQQSVRWAEAMFRAAESGPVRRAVRGRRLFLSRYGRTCAHTHIAFLDTFACSDARPRTVQLASERLYTTLAYLSKQLMELRRVWISIPVSAVSRLRNALYFWRNSEKRALYSVNAVIVIKCSALHNKYSVLT